MSNVIEFSLKMIDDATAAMGKVESGLSGIEKSLLAAGVAAAAYATVRLAQASLDNAEAMGTAAEKANINVEAYSALVYAAEQSNVSSGALSTGLRMLNKSIADSTVQNSAASLAFAGLGVSTTDVNGKLRTTDSVLLDIADAFAGAKDDANQTAYAMAIFGQRSGSELVPLLNQGSAAITSMMDKARKLGLVIDEDFAKSADNVNDSMATLSQVVGGAFNVAMKEVSPVLEQITGQMIDLATEGNAAEEMGRAIAAGLKIIVSVGLSVAGVFKTVGDLLGGLAAAAVSIAEGEFGQAADILKETYNDVGSNIESTFDEVSAVWDKSAQDANAAAARQMAAMRGTGKELDNLNEKTKLAAEVEKEYNKALEDAEQLINSQRTASEAHAAMLQQINDLKAAGALTADQHTEAIRRENEAWLESTARVQEYGQTATSVMDSLQVLLEQKMATMQSFAMQYAAMLLVTFDNLAKGIGNSVADAVVDGANLMDLLDNVLKQFVKQMIATWVQMQVQRVIYAQLGNKTEAMAATSRITSQAGVVFTATYADVAENMDYGWLYGAAIAAAAAAAAESGGLAFVAAGQAAHGGLDFVPSESTFLLQQGERVLSPRQNEDLTSFLEESTGGGGMTIQSLTIHVLENATNIDSFARMDKIQLRNALGYPIIDALNEMWNIGVRPEFASGAK